MTFSSSVGNKQNISNICRYKFIQFKSTTNYSSQTDHTLELTSLGNSSSKKKHLIGFTVVFFLQYTAFV